jgi:hypothetical protein
MRIVTPDGSAIVPTFSHGTLIKALARIDVGTTGPPHRASDGC